MRRGRQPRMRRTDPKTVKNHCTCPNGIAYVGNIFLLGLATLVGELVDLQAASALELLLQPFQGENGTDLEQDILAADLGNTIDNVDLLNIINEKNF